MNVMESLEHVRHRLDVLCEARNRGSFTVDDEAEYGRLAVIERDLLVAKRSAVPARSPI